MSTMENINLPLPTQLRDEIDQVRGDVARTVWIRRACEMRLERDNAPAAAGTPGTASE